MSDLLQQFAREVPSNLPNTAPRDAATLILIDRSGPSPKVLLGRRHQGHVFVPNRFVFPGGRVDARDRLMSIGTPLDPRAEAKLMREMRRPSAGKARSLVLAAIRETFEETGLLIGSKTTSAPKAPPGPWAEFAGQMVQPDLAKIHFIARAITPPRRPRRYDTRFFTADISAVAHRVEGVVGPEAELVELVWLPIDDTKQLDLMAITQLVLRDLQAQIEAGFSHDLPIPFYHVRHGKRVRDLL